ncbi:response regulator [Chitinophaga polysaccharea]|uniref:Response regulator n=1 Tax=Chitinophaga eiseniae TaxID=634771 RepID=A0A847SG77_9BACT|nr:MULTISPECIES: response regulator [Chitinophaga]NLR60199.1 response regulator [Chitinophaga polysaccharea]NLR77817.1 response regulator [Chitinophaga eiseniae]NLU95847.1 response regulator [Chitinophaga sp. Ak27]
MKKKILIIDDSMPMRYLLEAVLGKEYSVVTAQDGLVAITWLLNGNKADLIITDLQMPNIDGWELLDYLSGSYLYQDTPVMVLSGFYADKTNDLTARYNSVREVLQKPFDPMQLLNKVDFILEKQLSATAI